MPPLNELLPLPWTTMIVAWVVTFIAATVQGTIGFGFAMISVPILSFVDPRLAPVPQIIMMLPLTAATAWRERHAVEIRSAAYVLAGRIPGAALGILLLKVAGAGTFDLLIGGSVLIAAVIVGSGLHIPRNRWTELLAGTASGVSAMLASIGGPPLALLYGGSRGDALRANLALIFVFGVTITLITRWVFNELTGQDIEIAAWTMIALFAGFYTSRFLIGRVEGQRLQRIVVLFSGLSAASLIIRKLIAS